MAIDPRTPILVGGGQISEREGGVQPTELIARAARLAAQEAGGSDPDRLLSLVDSVRIVGLLSWRYRDPGMLVAQSLGAQPRRSGYTGNGGSTPQVLVNQAAQDIAAGQAEVVLIGGAEAWRTRMRLKGQGERPDWTKQDDSVPAADIVVPEVPMEAPSERRIGLDRPSYVYPLFEQALRIRAERSIEEHAELLGRLWAGFSSVAQENPHAWVRRSFEPSELTTVSDSNRMISTPYPKLLNSNNMVDQGAALILCSVEVARRLGIPQSAWVFPHSGTESHDTAAIAARGALDRSPAIRMAGARALELAGIGADDLSQVDVYSCFPSAVQVAAAELGFSLNDPGRPLTVTGGLSFAGGPWNNYSTHAIATLATRLRQDPGTYGLVTANSGYLTKHAFGVYSTVAPNGGFKREDVQEQVDREPTTPFLEEYEGPAEVESWTVVHRRDGTPDKAFVSARTPSGERTLACVSDASDTAELAVADAAGRSVRIGATGVAHLH